MRLRACVGWALLAFAAAIPVSIAGLNLAATTLTALLAAAALRGEQVPWRAAAKPLTGAMAAYCAVAAVCSAAGVAPAVSFAMWPKDLHKLWIICLLLTALSFHKPEGIKNALAAGYVFAAGAGIGQTAFLYSGNYKFPLVRAHAFVHPVTFGEQMALMLLGIFCLLAAKGVPTRRSERGALWLLLVVVSAAFLFSQTRGAFIGVAAGLAALCLLDRRLRRLVGAAAAAGILVLALWELMPTGHSFGQMLDRFRNAQPNSFLARVVFWKVGWRMFLDHPWLGAGPGNYRTLFTRYFSGEFDGETVWGSAHNLYIHEAAERGLLGLAALAGVLSAMTSRAWRRAKDNPDAVNLWALSATAAFLAMNLTEVAFQTEQLATLMLFIWCWAEIGNDPPRRADG